MSKWKIKYLLAFSGLRFFPLRLARLSVFQSFHFLAWTLIARVTCLKTIINYAEEKWRQPGERRKD